MEFKLKAVPEKKNTNVIIKDSTTFTTDQEYAIKHIIEFIAAPFNPADYIIGLVGKGGTGKTFIVDYIIKHCIYSPSVITCTSPTHKACRVFSQSIGNKNVDTIQSTFGFRLNVNIENFDPNNPAFAPVGQIKLDITKLLIIDEASMLPAALVTYICKICKTKEIKILFLGDDHQLFPVNESKSNAFARCSKIYTLNQIIRQDNTNPIVNLLDIIRDDIDNRTYNFISYIINHIGYELYNDNNEGFSIVNNIDFKNYVDIYFHDKEYTKNIDMYRIVAYTNNTIIKWNNYIRNSIIKDADKNIITKNDLLMSYNTIVDEYGSVIINNSEEYIIKDIVDYIDPSYNFKGFYIRFQQVHGGFVTRPLFIINHKDIVSIKRYYDVANELITSAKTCVNKSERVRKWKAYYTFKRNYLLLTNIVDKHGKVQHSRDIDYAFAISAHKSQGSTYDNVFVDLNDMIYNKNGKLYTNQQDLLRRIYVACSRTRKKLIIGYK